MTALGLRGGRSAYQAVLVLLFGVGLAIACGSNDDTPGDEADAGTDGPTSNPPPGTSTDGSSSNPPQGGGCAVNTCPTGAKCDATLGCVACVNDGDCTTNTRAPFCVLGRCEACKSNADCGVAAPACYPGDHQCHTACNVDGGARCTKGTPICDPTTGACLGCNSATDCRPEFPICEPTTKSCVKCAKDADCPATANKCSPTRFECVNCITTADCKSGERCGLANRCVPGCTSNDQCTGAEAKICDFPTGNCVQCLSPTDCAGTSTPICSLGHRCVQCIGSNDCADGGNKFCHDAKCVQCRNDNDCPGQNGNCDNDVCK